MRLYWFVKILKKKIDFHKNLNCKKQRNRLLSFFSRNEVEKDLANFYRLLKLVKFEQNSHKVRFSTSLISKLIRYFK